MTDEEIEAWLKIQEESAAALRKRWQNVVADDERRFRDEQIAYERERAAKLVRQLMDERRWKPIEIAALKAKIRISIQEVKLGGMRQRFSDDYADAMAEAALKAIADAGFAIVPKEKPE